MQEHQPRIDEQTEKADMAGQSEAEQHFKTLAVRVEEGLHAQLRFLAGLNLDPPMKLVV